MENYPIMPICRICPTLGKFAIDLNKAETMLNILWSDPKENMNYS